MGVIGTPGEMGSAGAKGQKGDDGVAGEKVSPLRGVKCCIVWCCYMKLKLFQPFTQSQFVFLMTLPS